MSKRKENKEDKEGAVAEQEENGIEECNKPCGGSRIEVVRERDSGDDEWRYYWMLYAKNGRMLATNPKPFERLNDLKEAIQSVKENVAEADLVRLY